MENFDSQRIKFYPPIGDELDGVPIKNFEDLLKQFGGDFYNTKRKFTMFPESVDGMGDSNYFKKFWQDIPQAANAGETVSITLSGKDYFNAQKPIVEVGELIRFGNFKRIWVEVTESDMLSFKGSNVYRPAPKSTLHKYPKSIFSKQKNKIVKLTSPHII